MNQSAAGSPQLLIEEWSAVLTTRTGLKLYVRPASPDDAMAMRLLFAELTPDDLRFRFLSPLKQPCASLLDMLVDLDHVRSEDYLVFVDVGGDKMLIASAMLSLDPGGERAEVAIAVRADYKTKGVGWTLLDFVAREAEARGVKVLESIECRDNRAAIELEREMGFTISFYPGDASLNLVSKTLGPVQ